MKQVLLLTLLAASALTGYGQSYKSSQNSVTALGYGISTLNFQRINEQLFPGSMGFENFLHGPTISYNTYTETENEEGTRHMDIIYLYHHFIPQTINTGPHNYSLKGNNIVLLAGVDLAHKSKTLDLLWISGLNGGRITFRQQGSDKQNQHNYHLGANTGAELRLNFGSEKKTTGLTIGIRGWYQIDFTKRSWKVKQEDTQALPGFKTNGWHASLLIGRYDRKP